MRRENGGSEPLRTGAMITTLPPISAVQERLAGLAEAGVIREDSVDLPGVLSYEDHAEEPILVEHGRAQVGGGLAVLGRREVGHIELEEAADAIERRAHRRRALGVGTQVRADDRLTPRRERHLAIRQHEHELVVAERLLIRREESPVLTRRTVEGGSWRGGRRRRASVIGERGNSRRQARQRRDVLLALAQIRGQLRRLAFRRREQAARHLIVQGALRREMGGDRYDRQRHQRDHG